MPHPRLTPPRKRTFAPSLPLARLFVPWAALLMLLAAGGREVYAGCAQQGSINIAGRVEYTTGAPVQGAVVTMTMKRASTYEVLGTSAGNTGGGGGEAGGSSGGYQFTGVKSCDYVYDIEARSTEFINGARPPAVRASISGCTCSDMEGPTLRIYVNRYGITEDQNAGEQSCQSVGEPVNVTSGNMYLQQTDYRLPGVGPALDLTRTYNSSSNHVTLFGRGWATGLDEFIRPLDAYQVLLHMPDGRSLYFYRPTLTAAFKPQDQYDLRGQMVKNADGSYALTLKDRSIHRFNPASRLTSVADRNGNRTVLTYGPTGVLATVTDPFGRVLNVTTDGDGRVTSVGDQLGVVAAYTYGPAQELLTVTYADNSQYRFEYAVVNGRPLIAAVKDALGNVLEAHAYDTSGRAKTSERHGGVEKYTLNYYSATETRVTDALGRLTKYFFDASRPRRVLTRVEGSWACGGSRVETWAYDAQLNVTTRTNALGQSATYTYDANGNRLTETDSLGTTAYTYDSFGQVLTATDPMGGVTTYTYDAAGNLLTLKNPLNKTTTFAYTPRGQLASVTDARSNTTEFTYDAGGNLVELKDAALNSAVFVHDPRGRLTSATDALDDTTAYEYDAAWRVKKVILPDGAFVTFTYDLAGRRTKVTDARNNSTDYEYDGAYRLTKVTDAMNHAVVYGYDLMSNPTSVTDQLGRTTNYEYDEFNRLKKYVYPPAAAGAVRSEVRVSYDAAGNVTKLVDAAGRETAYTYDAANRLIKVTDPALKATQFEYNARSQRTAVVDTLGQRYEFAHDPLGRLLSQTRAGLSMSYEYDAVGNRTRRVDYNGRVTDYAYDALGRLTTVTYPDATTAVYAYDALSRPTSATNQYGTVTTAYDGRGRVSSTTDVWGRTITYGYDANGNRTSMQSGAVPGAAYGYDAADRLTHITDDAGATVTFGYDAARRPTSRTLPNGVTTTYAYDGLDRLTRLTHAAGATVLADYQHQFDAANQITQIAEPGGTRTFTRDAADRLTGVTNTNGAHESYGYDAVGNRTSSHLSAGYSFLAFNRLAGAGADSYSHDANGNLVSKTDSAGSWTYEWDYENRLKKVSRPGGQSVVYHYDALGRRTRRVEGPSSTEFTYDGPDRGARPEFRRHERELPERPGPGHQAEAGRQRPGAVLFSRPPGEHEGSGGRRRVFGRAGELRFVREPVGESKHPVSVHGAGIRSVHRALFPPGEVVRPARRQIHLRRPRRVRGRRR